MNLTEIIVIVVVFIVLVSIGLFLSTRSEKKDKEFVYRLRQFIANYPTTSVYHPILQEYLHEIAWLPEDSNNSFFRIDQKNQQVLIDFYLSHLSQKLNESFIAQKENASMLHYISHKDYDSVAFSRDQIEKELLKDVMIYNEIRKRKDFFWEELSCAEKAFPSLRYFDEYGYYVKLSFPSC